MTRRCPKCGHQQSAGAAGCEACGIVFAKRHHEPAVVGSERAPVAAPRRSRRLRHPWLFLLAVTLALAVGCRAPERETAAPVAASQPTEEVASTRPDDRVQKIAELKDLAWTYRNRIEGRLEALKSHRSESEDTSQEYDRVVEALDRLLEELRVEVEEKIATGHAKLDGLAVELAAERVRTEALRPLVPSNSARAAKDSWRAWHRVIEEQRENIAKRRAVAEQYPERYPPGHEDLGRRRYNLPQ